MSDPLTSKAQRREYVGVRDGFGLRDVLSSFQMPPEVRIADRPYGCSKDHEDKE